MSVTKIGLSALTALVISSMIGSGIFSLPQNMAAVAGSQALLIGWLITGIGIIFLGLSFACLSRLLPELDGGVYAYARAGFGDLIGFAPPSVLSVTWLSLLKQSEHSLTKQTILCSVKEILRPHLSAHPLSLGWSIAWSQKASRKPPALI